MESRARHNGHRGNTEKRKVSRNRVKWIRRPGSSEYSTTVFDNVFHKALSQSFLTGFKPASLAPWGERTLHIPCLDIGKTGARQSNCKAKQALRPRRKPQKPLGNHGFGQVHHGQKKNKCCGYWETIKTIGKQCLGHDHQMARKNRPVRGEPWNRPGHLRKPWETDFAASPRQRKR